MAKKKSAPGNLPYERKDWTVFRATGLFHFVNSFLHIFGWVIVVDMDSTGRVLDVYPARTSYRGFSEESNTLAYERVEAFMKQEWSKKND